MPLARKDLLALSLTWWIAYASSTSKRDETMLSVTAPKAGDAFGLDTASERTGIGITWTVPDAIASRPVFLSLVQGDNLTSLAVVAPINGPSRGSIA